MKIILTLSLILSVTSANAENINPLPNFKANLEGMLKVTEGRKTFSEMKTIANDKNIDVDVAFENYLIAKKNVAIARARFNPVTTGHLLGISLGLTFFWAPIVVEGILSIPTKIYNTSKNRHLAKASLYNLYEARDVLNNELAHLYYDILTHEVILKSIDQEMQILSYQETKRAERNASSADAQKYILRLGMERIDIYNMYVAELSEIRTLTSTANITKYELAQIFSEPNPSVIENLDQYKLQIFAVKNSNKYKTAVELNRASHSNVKQVQWSIFSWSGISFSYGRQIKTAKNEEKIANLREDSTEQEVKNNVLLQLQKLGSAMEINSNFSSLSDDSLKLFADTYQLFLLGQASEDAAIEASLGAISDFRSKVLAHYGAWSSFDDFSNSVSYELNGNENKSAQEQIETSPLYQVDPNEFHIVKVNNDDSYTIALSSPKIGTVSKVNYIFNSDEFKKLTSDKGRDNYAVTIEDFDLNQSLSGTAEVVLDNGKKFNIQFSL